MEVSIIANGTVKSGAWLRKNIAGTIIAADGGADTCLKHGIVPDYVIGDFDSVKKKTLAAFRGRSKIVRIPDQNSTDLQKALALASRLGAESIAVFGAIGSELDHTLANILSLDARCIMKDETHDIRVITKSIKVEGKRGDIVSVIALSDIRGLTYRGLQWGVSNRSVPAGWTGIRNRLSAKRARISLASGRAAVILQRHGKL